MAAPVPTRRVLFPLYAFNAEVARAPWVTKEPMIAQMRLQWWHDVLEEIKQGGPVRRHEVATPLAAAIGAPEAELLQKLVAARHLDIERAPFGDNEALLSYLSDTAGGLALAAARGLGLKDTALTVFIAIWGQAAGLARYMQAVASLEAQGKLPLPDGREDSISAHAQTQLANLAKLSGAMGLFGLRRRLGKGADAAVIEFWHTRALLTQIAKQPARVAQGTVGISEFGKKVRLITASL